MEQYFDFLVYLLSYYLIFLYSKFRKFQDIQIYSKGKSEYKIRKTLTLRIQKINNQETFKKNREDLGPLFLLIQKISY